MGRRPDNGSALVNGFTFGDLEAAISSARANRYLASTVDPVSGVADPARAVALYEHNVEVSTAAWSTVADLEVVLRNIIAGAIETHHATLRGGHGERWYDPPPWFATGKWFTSGTLDSISVAMKRGADPGPGPSLRPGGGRVVAELTLGFWRYLLTARYEHSLWNPAIRARFQGLSHLSGSDSRKEVHERVEKLNYLRNRVAHHEPVYDQFRIPGHPGRIDTVATLDDAIEMIGWSNPDAANWIRARSAYASVAARRP